MTPEPEWVDLGLPSGLLWAKANLGATLPESYGLYFSWGNTDGHPAGAGYDFSQEVYDATPAAAISADLSLEQDAARVNLGAPWRLPAAVEFQELNTYCDSVWTSINGVNGRLFTSRRNGNTLFFPAAGYYVGTIRATLGASGYYWSSTHYNAANARDLDFTSSNINPQDSFERRCGFPIRPVRSA